jgi:hypothetical protein
MSMRLLNGGDPGEPDHALICRNSCGGHCAGDWVASAMVNMGWGGVDGIELSSGSPDTPQPSSSSSSMRGWLHWACSACVSGNTCWHSDHGGEHAPWSVSPLQGNTRTVPVGAASAGPVASAAGRILPASPPTACTSTAEGKATECKPPQGGSSCLCGSSGDDEHRAGCLCGLPVLIEEESGTSSNRSGLHSQQAASAYLSSATHSQSEAAAPDGTPPSAGHSLPCTSCQLLWLAATLKSRRLCANLASVPATEGSSNCGAAAVGELSCPVRGMPLPLTEPGARTAASKPMIRAALRCAGAGICARASDARSRDPRPVPQHLPFCPRPGAAAAPATATFPPGAATALGLRGLRTLRLRRPATVWHSASKPIQVSACKQDGHAPFWGSSVPLGRGRPSLLRRRCGTQHSSCANLPQPGHLHADAPKLGIDHTARSAKPHSSAPTD